MNNNNIERPEFIEHFIERRLKRVPIAILNNFLLKLTLENYNLEDRRTKRNKQHLVKEVMFYYKLKRDKKEFNLVFNEFIRDYVFSAKESEYLIQVPDKKKVINWVNSWRDGKYVGRRYNFSRHTPACLTEMGESQ